ncbi:hypothetical protein CONCODRAFT_8825 [Conidiobolus coronatus NRRL 28638]|uniref:Late embryogenesis abundant protein LEA-2 subgroup domain-containing protein n=1 Tax=Conidiobolus coronatus (strain ATCC 28846 / CBS 209.66 / NRRL 28638) TaxID=796925 RepID=A0A137P1V3_CONC2|nr:hypothetical protein CONCODRAFT_8825 [Conidiobolus coronatus NRRL 28638]|eukprot:KXN68861.1 hypothetical protein CONCODRAFT_8825 [Conidiobolus coronatus NRRL 28638]
MNLKNQIDSPHTIKFINFKSKTGPLQVLWLLIEIIVFLICLILVIASYMISLPEVELVAGTIPRDPREMISLKQFPNLQIKMDVIGFVKNKNYLPLPASLYVKGSIDSDDPQDRIIYGDMENIVIMPGKFSVVVPVTGNINLFESRIRSLRSVLDSCGITSEYGDRTPIKFNIYADTYIGYGVFKVFLKTLILKIELPCPLVEKTLGPILLGYANNLIF